MLGRDDFEDLFDDDFLEEDMPWDHDSLPEDPRAFIELAQSKRSTKKSSYRSSYEEEDFAALKDADRPIDLSAFIPQAWQRIFQHYVCALGSGPEPSTYLLTEAELHIQSHDYRQALICTLATEQLGDANELRRDMIKCICLYQKGDKAQAEGFKEKALTKLGVDPKVGFPAEEGEIVTADDYGVEGLSDFLFARFIGTCEVLNLMPELLNMLASMGGNRDK